MCVVYHVSTYAGQRREGSLGTGVTVVVSSQVCARNRIQSSGGAATAVPESPAQMEVIYNLLQLSVLHARIHVAVLLNL